MKSYLLAPRNATREILSPADAEKMLSGGSWVRVTLAKPSAVSKRQRDFRRRRRSAGYRQLSVLLPEQFFDELVAMKRPGETEADLLTRLVASYKATQQ